MKLTATVFALLALFATQLTFARSLTADLAPTVPGKLTYFEGESVNLQLTLSYTPDALQTPLQNGSSYLTGDYATDGSASVYWPLGPTNSSTFGSGNTRVINYSRTYIDETTVNVSTNGYMDTQQVTQYWDYEGFFHYRWFYNYTDTRFSFSDSLSLQVLNANPVIDGLSGSMQVDAGHPFVFGGHATDPGINDVLTYLWDLDADGQYDDWTGSSGTWSYLAAGPHIVSLLVTDGDGGSATSGFLVTTMPVPEPSSLGLGACGCAAILAICFRRTPSRRV